MGIDVAMRSCKGITCKKSFTLLPYETLENPDTNFILFGDLIHRYRNCCLFFF